MKSEDVLSQLRQLLIGQLQGAWAICCGTEPPLSKMTFIARNPTEVSQYIMISTEALEDLQEIFTEILRPGNMTIIDDQRKETLQ